MHVLSSPIQYIKLRRAHKKQKRTALHMLALSGVVRPSHVELRYATRVASVTAFRAQPTAIEDPQTHPVPLPSWDHNITLNMKQTRAMGAQPLILPCPTCEKTDPYFGGPNS